MAEIFDFYVNDNRSITFKLSEPIMLEDNGVSDWRFHIPNIVNGLDATGWAWWLVYVNAKNEKYTIPLTLEYDYDRPDAYSIATYTVDYGISCKVGNIKFSLEAIDTDTGGTILHEWHTKTYSTNVVDTLQGNQVEYAETESDIISALIVELQTKTAALFAEIQRRTDSLVGGATPLPVNLKSLMTDHDKVYLYTGSESGESTGYWYHWNGTNFVPGGLYASGIVIDPTGTQSGMAADAKVVGDEFETIANLGNSTGADYSPWTSGKTILNTGKIGTSNTNSACSEFIKIPSYVTAVTVKCNGYFGVVGMYSDNTEESYINRLFVGATGSVAVDLTNTKYIRIAIGSLDISDTNTIEIKCSYALKTTVDTMITDITNIINAVENIPLVDVTLSNSGQAADAKVTGDSISDVKNDVADKFADISNILDMSLVEEVNKTDTSSAKNASGATLISSYGFSNGAYFPIEYPIDAEKIYVVAMRYNNGDAARTCRWGFCDKEKNQIGGDNYVNLSSGLVGQPSASGIIVYVTNSTNLDTIQSATIDWIQLVEQSEYNAHGGTEYEYIKPVHISERLNEIESSLKENIYGIKISSNGTVTRTDGAVGLNNDYVIGSIYQNGGHNDFDLCYPWSDIKLCNIYADENGDEQIVYFGDEGFSRVNKNTYVEIPKFYSLRYEDSNGNQYIKITGSPHRNFLLEPCFYDSVTGNVIDKIYVGVYHSSGENNLASVSGAIPTTLKSFSFFKQNSEMYDFVTLMAIQKLFSVEFAVINTSLIFGGYSNLAWNNAIYPYANVTNTNTGEFIGDSRIKNLVVGSIISINQTFGVIENREITAITDPIASGSRWRRTITFSGEPIDLIIPDGLPTADRQKLYCSAQKTGATDNLVYHTGRTDYNVGDPLLANQFRYRWMEGLWGTVGEFIDGVVVKNLRLYWDYIRANYGNVELSHKINFKIPLQNTYSTSPNPLPQYIKKMGIDFRHPQITVPLELTNDDESFYGDGFYSIDTVGPDGQSFDANTIFVGCSSMAWDGKYSNGLYCLRFWSPSTTGGAWLYGSRMIKRHFD